MSDKELIARLRSSSRHPMMDNNCKVDVFLVNDAADRIEALIAERDQWVSHAKAAIWSDSEELKETERRLAKAVEAIEARIHWSAGGLHCDCGECAALVATLAEIKSSKAAPPYGLKGESHE